MIMRKIAWGVASLTALVVSAFGAVGSARAATDTVVLRNTNTGLCVDRPQEEAGRTMRAFTAACDGASTQRWVYSETEHTIRTSDTGQCLATGWVTAVSIAACDSGAWVRWGVNSDGRIHLLEWEHGCLEDTRSEYLTWGGCDNNANEIWSLTTA